jgi:hypothetical protein
VTFEPGSQFPRPTSDFLICPPGDVHILARR